MTDALRVNSSLKSLRIQNSDISKNEARDFAKALSANTTLTELDLNDTSKKSPNRQSRIVEGVDAVIDIIGTNTTLTKLTTWSIAFQIEEGSALVKALQANTTLKALTLGQNFDLPETEAQMETKSHIATILERNNGLATLMLSRKT